MTVTVTGNEIHRHGAFLSAQVATFSTSTALQTINHINPVTTIDGGTTATGFGVGRFLLSTASAVEGMEKTIVLLATGELKIILTGTSTGALALNEANDFVFLRYMNESWRLISNGGATLATATGTA
jgi:predicted TIM-barrel enzyme